VETLTCIKTRRSIRNFTEQEIPENLINELLEAVRWAPSWANTQCWEVIVVKEQAIKEQIAQMIPGNNPAPKAIIAAPVVMVMCAIKGRSGYKNGEILTNKGDWAMFDLGIACQNLCLAAHALGLGTVHVGTLDHNSLDKLLKLPPNLEAIEVIPVGYPAREGKVTPRKGLSEFVHLNFYGESYYN
jgi:nitroreductase